MGLVGKLFNKKKPNNVDINLNSSKPNEYPVYDSSGKLSEKAITFILDNRYEDLEFAIRGVKKIWKNNEFKFIKKERHCYSEEVIENILSKLQGWLSIDVKLASFGSSSFTLFMCGGIYKGEEVDGLLDLIVDYFQEITIIEVPKFKKFIDGIKTPYPNSEELSDEEVYMLMRESAEICNLVRVRVYAIFSRAVGGQENKQTHGSIKSADDPFANSIMGDLDKL